MRWCPSAQKGHADGAEEDVKKPEGPPHTTSATRDPPFTRMARAWKSSRSAPPHKHPSELPCVFGSPTKHRNKDRPVKASEHGACAPCECFPEHCASPPGRLSEATLPCYICGIRKAILRASYCASLRLSAASAIMRRMRIQCLLDLQRPPSDWAALPSVTPHSRTGRVLS